MKLFLRIFFITLIIIASSARADELEDELCKKSNNCKKVCKLKRNTTYGDLTPEDQKSIVSCVNDIAAELNAKASNQN